MRILILNSGSSSIKFQVIETTTEDVLAKGKVEKIGLEDSMYSYYNYLKDIKIVDEIRNFKDHKDALTLVTSLLDIEKIEAIGHRVVHGGEYFVKPTIINDRELEMLEEIKDLAPLHNPANILGIKVCLEIMPDKKNVAVFDTAFHNTIKEDKYIYAIPYEYYEKYKVRKYGFHGTSVKYVSMVANKMLLNDKSKLIVCHLGNGASITAVDSNKSVNTSMGFTPLAGIPMGTRSGDIDPSILKYIMNKENIDISKMTDILNENSGMLGICGTPDNRDLTELMHKGDRLSKLAFDIFCDRVASFIASYYVELEGADAIVFTGGIGENSAETRKHIVDKLKVLGVNIDDKLNYNLPKIDSEISLNSDIKVLVIRTNEELMISKEVEEILR